MAYPAYLTSLLMLGTVAAPSVPMTAQTPTALMPPAPAQPSLGPKLQSGPTLQFGPTLQSSLPLGKRSIAQSSPSTASMVQAIHSQVNQYRASKGLRPLTLDSRISAQSLAHSQAMASKKVPFSHQGFQARVDAIKRSIPYQGAAENVAFNFNMPNPADQAVQGWLKSKGHRQNIEGDYNLTGIGVSRNAKGEYYYTQIFIKSR
jgi:uncharacterized protein YkwD